MFNQPDKEIIRQAMEIAAELSEEESAIIVFLCMDLVNSHSLIGEVKELFEFLSKENLLRFNLLTELLYRIRRLDILKKFKVDLMNLESNLRAGKGCVSSYRQLLVDINEDLTQEDLRSILFLLSYQIPKGRLETVKSFLDLVVELEKAGKIDENNLAVVEDCLTNIRRIDLTKKIQKYKQMGECVHSIRRSDAYQNVIPLSIPQQECGFYPEHVERSWEMSSVQPVFTPQLLRQHVHSNWPSFATASSEENGVKALSMSLSMSKQPKPAGASWPAQQLQNEVETYKMQSNPIGLCLIIDCIGTDADLLKETFEALKFCVLLHLYIKLDEMEKILKEVSERDDLATIDCFVCCIISRGTPDSMLAVDGSNHGLSFDQIQCYFKGQPCHPLLGKPRLFFIQDFLWTPVDGELEVPEVPIQVDGNNWKEIVPQEADILWSCCQVAQSLLHLAPQQPSSFMRTLSESLRKHQHKSDLVSILTEVNRKTMLRNHQLSRLQSKPLILRHTLRKKLVFP
ncbi:CASP8 and FADD-like apoptosis regulator isoform X1 [Narcine bancroftii]|uniref:CASP8 and FADD-like apoptosis regulator isoform X1 n=1 Tax=Narcine bancroftii TaxID=1343680 RepID=UPI003831780B